jgi:hypothetical protein
MFWILAGKKLYFGRRRPKEKLRERWRERERGRERGREGGSERGSEREERHNWTLIDHGSSFIESVHKITIPTFAKNVKKLRLFHFVRQEKARFLI